MRIQRNQRRALNSRNGIALCAAVTAILFGMSGLARAYEESDRALADIEELIHLEVTSVSKKSESINKAAAAVFVITGEDIRRSGSRSIPEALRMAPGIQVSQMTGNLWAISSRGFNSEFADSLLVLIDGRSVYTPLFGGVYWDIQDTLLEDIDRIEVIRGAGGTLWGANAVTGVINIVTKSAEKTQGGYVQAGGGNIENYFASMRYGGKVGENLSYRIYGKFFNRDHNEPLEGSSVPVSDESDQKHAGWRIDWQAGERDHLTFQGDAYHGNSDNFLGPAPSLIRDKVKGENTLLRWERSLSADQDLSLQFYYDRSERVADDADDTNEIWDLEFQHRRPFVVGSEVIWGLGYRRNISNYVGLPRTAAPVSFAQPRRTDDLYTGFLQFEFPLFDDSLHLIAGTKVERNDYTGWEFQPTARFAWAPNDKHTLWGAVSRASTTPPRIQDEARMDFGVIVLDGNDKLDAATVDSVELGYRVQVLDSLHLDMTAFYNSYKDRYSSRLIGMTFFPPPLKFDLKFDNNQRARSRGGELVALWRATERWQVEANYSYLYLTGKTEGLPSGFFPDNTKAHPTHQVKLRSLIDLPFNLQFDSSMFYVSRLVGGGASGYTRFDFRLGWEPVENLELSAAILGAFDKRHDEAAPATPRVAQTEVARSWYLSATYRF